MRSTIAALMALAAGVFPAAAPATVPAQNGKIAFEGGSTLASEIYTVNPDGMQLAQLTTNPGVDEDPAWSPDGTRLAFASAPDANSPRGLWIMNADGSGKSQLTAGDAAHEDLSPAWSPDGTKITFVRADRAAGGCSQIYMITLDVAVPVPLAAGPECRQDGLDWSPDGTMLTYRAYDDALDQSGIYVANADNTATTKISFTGGSPSWSPGANWIAYGTGLPYNGSGGIQRTTPDGQHVETTNADPRWRTVDWSPDGARQVIGSPPSLATMNDAGLAVNVIPGLPPAGDPDWQPIPPAPVTPGYSRPRGATPLSVSLVPAFEQCAAPDNAHGAPLSFGSCSPPVQSSGTLTAGTPDANGEAAQSIGRVALAAVVGKPATSEDEADVRLTTTITDVRCRNGGIPGCDAPLGDYTGGLRQMFETTLTDRYNGGLGTESATGTTFPSYQPILTIVIPCVATPDTTVGATCSVDTTAEALTPGMVKEGTRATWQLGRIEIWDAGEDGNPLSDDNTRFAVQGVFVP